MQYKFKIGDKVSVKSSGVKFFTTNNSPFEYKDYYTVLEIRDTLNGDMYTIDSKCDTTKKDTHEWSGNWLIPYIEVKHFTVDYNNCINSLNKLEDKLCSKKENM